jgi:hypothetical protein
MRQGNYEGYSQLKFFILVLISCRTPIMTFVFSRVNTFSELTAPMSPLTNSSSDDSSDSETTALRRVPSPPATPPDPRLCTLES